MIYISLVSALLLLPPLLQPPASSLSFLFSARMSESWRSRMTEERKGQRPGETRTCSKSWRKLGGGGGGGGWELGETKRKQADHISNNSLDPHRGRLPEAPLLSPFLPSPYLFFPLLSSPLLPSPYLSSPLLTFSFLSSPLPFPPVPLLSSYPLIIPAAVSLLINFSVLSRAPDCSSPQTALRSVLLLPRSYSRSPLPVSHLASNECRG